MTTLTLDTRITETKGAFRREIESIRSVVGELKNYSAVSRELSPGETLVIMADRFLVMSLTTEVVAVITLTSYISGPSNTVQQSVKLVGSFIFPGKISISITNPADSSIELPVGIVAYYE
jgi:hypothetical protein